MVQTAMFAEVRDWASLFTLIAAVATGVFALFRYMRSERLRQTEQVRELYRMFFETDRYRRMRFVLDNPKSPEFEQLRVELAAGGMPGVLEGELIDLMNFLEFVTGLTRRGLLARKDVDWMFSSFIRRIAETDFLHAYVQSEQYEELEPLCGRMTRGKRKAA